MFNIPLLWLSPLCSRPHLPSHFPRLNSSIKAELKPWHSFRFSGLVRHLSAATPAYKTLVYSSPPLVSRGPSLPSPRLLVLCDCDLRASGGALTIPCSPAPEGFYHQLHTLHPWTNIQVDDLLLSPSGCCLSDGDRPHREIYIQQTTCSHADVNLLVVIKLSPSCWNRLRCRQPDLNKSFILWNNSREELVEFPL